ncbi:MAG: protein kinase [Rhodococcus sp. (in: high G+C Gram-positive bacteria)]
MGDVDPFRTQRADPGTDYSEELAVEGFEDAQEIGRGGFGIVYRCVQSALDRTVAVKFLTADPDPGNLERFIREQRAMGRLSGHPNIANILQVGTTTSGRPYIVMQFHQHGSLDSQIRRSGPLAWDTVLHLGVRLSGALEIAHRSGILHRDVKPANVLLTDYGEPQLTDFGIARIAGGFETTTGTVTGSPAFTAPEVLRGRTPEPHADVYSLGATLFCALTGHAAFERRDGEQVVAQFLRITSQPVPDLRGGEVPDPVCAVIEHSMATDPADRPSSAAAFGNELREAQRRSGTGVDPMPLPLDVAQQANLTSGSSTAAIPARPGRGLTWSATPTPSPVGGRGYASPTTPPPSPATKFRPPAPARSLVTRTRLLATLSAAGRRRLIVIHAPTGYGKSILAAQWRQLLAEQSTPTAWLTVDNDDNNPVWFLAHLLESVEKVRPDLTGTLRQELEEHGADAERFVLTTLLDRIHESGERMVLVLDDWHRVTDPAPLAALRFVLDNGCHHLQILITSRTRSGLPLSRMRMRDELVEIDSEALRFDTAESQSFLVDVGGLDLDRADVATLTHTTDGWVAGLQLASLSLRGRENPAQLIEQLSGRTQTIGEFLAENVLDSLDPALLEFLLSTSVCERLCGSLASALSGTEQGQLRLEQVEERDLFLRRTDEDGRWFRYHHLFAQFLQHRLERDQPDKIPALHRAAATWFADHNLLGEAVDHALAATEQAWAVELVEHHGMDLLEHARMSTLLGLIAKLPSHLVSDSVRLQLILGWANSELLRPEPVHAALDRIDDLLAHDDVTPGAAADLRAEAGVVKAESLLFADHVTGIKDLIADCLAHPDTLRPWVVSAAAGLAAFAEIYRFDFDAARAIHDWARPYYDRAGGPYSVVWGHCIIGVADNEQLRIDSAERHFREGLRIATDAGGPHSHPARLASALLGELLYERGDLAQAQHLLDESYALGSEGGVDFMLGPYVVGARIKALTGDLDGAATRLDEGRAIARTLDLPRLRARIDNERIRLGLEHSGSPARGRMRPTRDGIDEIVAQYDDCSAIMTMLDDPTPTPRTATAAAWASEWVHHLQGGGRDRALLQARRLLVACLASAGRGDEAQALLAALAAQCAAHGLSRYLVDSGPPVAAVLDILWQHHNQHRWPPEWVPVPGQFLIALHAAAAAST